MKWKAFQKDGNLFMLKLDHVSDIIKINLTDLKSLWSESLDNETFHSRFKENNRIVEADFETAREQLTKIIDDLKGATVLLTMEETRVSLALETTFDSVVGNLNPQKLQYKFSLMKNDDSEFMNIVTVPMMQTINLLEKQRHMLESMLELKDKALEWYKMEKGSISRDDLKTEKFDSEILNVNDERLLINIFKSDSDFWNALVESHGKVEANVLDVQVNPWNTNKRKRVKRVYNSKTIQKKGSGITYNKKE